MYPIIEAFGLRLPLYGIMEIFSILVLTIFGIIIFYKSDLSLNDGIVLGAYGVLGAYIGSKMLFLLQNNTQFSLRTEDDWLRLMQSGGSAYGGILLGLFLSKVGARIHKIEYELYIEKILFLLPLCHGIWKIGCHCAGCCYGIPYTGIGKIVFVKGASTTIPIELFPVQLLETMLLFLISLYLLKGKNCSISTYLFLYNIIRFVIEFFRNVELKKMFGRFSDIQYMCIVSIMVILIIKYKGRKKFEKTV